MHSLLLASSRAHGAAATASLAPPSAPSVPSRPPIHITRSVTPTPPIPVSKPRFGFGLSRLTKSTPNIKETMMAAVMTPQKSGGGSSPAMRHQVDGDDYVMDTRTPSPISSSTTESHDGEKTKAQSGDGAMSSDKDRYQPDLSSEVAMLSTKLINAINYQTNLDDSLQATRHELEQVSMELRRVRAEKQSLDDAVTQGVLVKKAQFDETIAKLREELADEKARREAAEKHKKQTEAEVETLTSALFEEANAMVAAARKDTEAAEKRNTQLKSQLENTEFLMTSQQEQLQDLKNSMQRLEHAHNETREPSVPSTPDLNRTTATWDGLPEAPTNIDTMPESPLYFTDLLHPILRTDVSAYSDFAELLSSSRRTPHSRTASGNASQQSSTTHLGTSTSTITSSPSLPGAFTFNTSANSSPSSAMNASVPALKESRFYKRALIEDIEPTLRLDLAPGLTFLSRRSVIACLLNGTLAVEPFIPTNYKFYAPIFACSLCGESRKQDPYVRKHRFRTSESDDAQRYPLCDYCLMRIRATGNFLTFLRLVRDGHWRCECEEDEKGAWEEAIRLRERMFWARIGGGVVPAAFLKRDANETAALQESAESAETSALSNQPAVATEESTEEQKGDVKEISATDTPGAQSSESEALSRLSKEDADLQSPTDPHSNDQLEEFTTPTDQVDMPESSEEPKSDVDSNVALPTEMSEPVSFTESQPQPIEPQPTTTSSSKSTIRPITPRRPEPDTNFSPPVNHRSNISSPEGRRPGSSSSFRSQTTSLRISHEIPDLALPKRSPSPAKRPTSSGSGLGDGQRSSSVLDRVRAMEAKSTSEESS